VGIHDELLGGKFKEELEYKRKKVREEEEISKNLPTAAFSVSKGRDTTSGKSEAKNVEEPQSAQDSDSSKGNLKGKKRRARVSKGEGWKKSEVRKRVYSHIHLPAKAVPLRKNFPTGRKKTVKFKGYKTPLQKLFPGGLNDLNGWWT